MSVGVEDRIEPVRGKRSVRASPCVAGREVGWRSLGRSDHDRFSGTDGFLSRILMPAVIGREDELAALEAFLDADDAGSRALVLEGEAGIGKTTLWDAGVERARERGLRVLSARAAGSETRLSYAGLTDVLQDVPDEVLATLPAVQRHALEVALLRIEPRGSRVDHRTVAAGALGVLRALASDGPVVVALDDARWLDPASRDALSFALRRLDAEPVRFLAAARRSEGCDDAPDLARVLPDARCVRLEIGPLPVEAIERLLVVRLGRAPSGSALLDLYAVCGGNPLFALEIAKASLGEGTGTGGRTIAVPRELRAQVAGRLRGLPPDVGEVLLATAALTRPTAAILSRVAATGADALASAADTGLLEIHGGDVRPSHPLYASVAYADATPERRAEIHRRLAALVDDPEERARHLSLSATPPDAAVADALEEAAIRAGSRGATMVAAELWLEARTFTPSDAAGPTLRRGTMAADTFYEVGEHERAIALLEEMLPVCPAGRARAEVLWRLGWLGACGNGRLLDACDAWLGEARAQADGEPAFVSRIERARFLAAVQRYEPLRAAAHARAALRAATRTDDPTATATSLAMTAWGDAVSGRGLRKGTIERALRLWPSALDGRARWVGNEHPGCLGGAVLYYTDRLDEAREVFGSLRRDADEAGSEWTVSLALWWLCNVEILAGDWDLAARCADAGGRLPSNDWPGVHPRGLVAAHLGRVPDARRYLTWSLQRAQAIGVTDLVQLVLQTLGFLELSVGDHREAHRFLAPVTELFLEAGIVEPGMGRFLPDAIEALVGLGDLDEAERLTDWLEERGRALDRVSALASGARCRGLLLSARGDHQGALEHLERAMAEHERLPMPFERARTLLALGAVRRRAGSRRAAREALTEALDVFGRLGATLWAGKARAELATTGVRTADEGGHLSPMEERVAHLAVAGRTNREIAETLFLSVRTVESHLSHTYRKLGVRSRTELALVLEDPAIGPGAAH